MDDLFGAPPADAAPAPAPAMDDLFGAPPADAAPAPAEDLFSDPIPVAPVPAKQAPAVDDFFGEPLAPAPAPAEAPMDDLFGEPALPAPADAAPAADDIFGAPPATEPAAPVKNALDDLFGENSRFRVWIDNTGEFSTEGRLVEIGADYIRLLKGNGRICTVPNRRLCSADASFIAAVVKDHDGVKVAMLSAR